MRHTSKIIAVPREHLYLRVLWLILLWVSAPVMAGMTIEVGPTNIPRGEANGQQDITVSNGLFALGIKLNSARQPLPDNWHERSLPCCRRARQPAY